MNILGFQSKIAGFLDKKHVHAVLYMLFILGFFVSPSVHWHCKFYYAFIIPVYLVSLKKSRFRLFLSSDIWLISMALCLYLVLTLLWAENPGEEGAFYYLRRPLYLFVFLGMTMELAARYPGFTERLFVMLAWIGGLSALVSILCFYSSAPFPAARLRFLPDQIHGPIEGGVVYGMIALVIYFSVLKKTAWRWKWLYLLLLLIMVSSVFLSQSRGPAGSLIGVFFAGALITRDKKLLCALVCSVVVITVLFFNVEQFRKAVVGRGFSHRIEIGVKTLSRAKENLVFGKGISTNNNIIIASGKKMPHPHSIYTGIILYGGIIGFIILVMLFGAVFWRSFSLFLLAGDITCFLLLVFAAANVVTGQDKVITHPNSMWIFFWLPIGLLAGIMEGRKQGQGLNTCEQESQENG